MTTKELNQAMLVVRKAVAAAGRDLKPYYGNVESLSKGDGDGVLGVFTELDHKTERFLETELGTFSNAIGFRGEEFGVSSEADTTWLVDPIDGTAHFIRGLPFCTTMVALIEDGDVVLAAIHDISQESTYWAIKGQGAYCNDTPISVSQRSLKQGLVSFETHLEKPENYEKYMAARKMTNVISTVSSGYEMAMIASGKLEAKIGLDPYGKDWDFAPGSLVVREAGGVATNIGKQSYDYQDHDFIISNAVVHEELTSGADAPFPVI